MRIGVVSLFPGMFAVLRDGGITARAMAAGRLLLDLSNPRDFVHDPHRTVDDRPYGGGPGMVLKYAPLRDATRALRAVLPRARVVYLSPQGRRLDDAYARQLAGREELILVCGRYEGVDERFVASEVDEELSIGDYVLSGGEHAAMVVIDAVARLLPGSLGDAQSAAEDSFADGLLDCPHYTRPERIDGREVPEVLVSGDHGEIAKWRQREALRRTHARRPDLIPRARLTEMQRDLLATLEDNDELT